MKKQRGMADMVMVAIGIIAVLGLLVALQYGWTTYTNGLDKKGYDRGRSEALKEVGDRDSTALQAAIRERNTAQGKLDTALTANENNQKASDEAYRKGKRDAKNQFDLDLAAVKSGNLVLHSHQAAAGVGTGLKAPGDKDKVAGSGPGSAGSGDDRLSPDDSRFLLWLSGEANRLGKKVNALIDVVRGDRIQINGALLDQEPSESLIANLSR